MSRFELRYAERPRREQVLLALVPMDAFTGQIVSEKVGAQLSLVRCQGGSEQLLALPWRPIRNLSGMLVFLVQSEAQANRADLTYRIEVSARAAGYFNPAPIEFVPPPPEDPRPAVRRRRIVPLFRHPSADLGFGVTVVAGVLVRRSAGGGPAVPTAGARICATVQADQPPGAAPLAPFETRSAENGAFALRLRLPAVEARDQTVQVDFAFEEGGEARGFSSSVHEDRFHSFAEPIDLSGANAPPLVSSPR